MKATTLLLLATLASTPALAQEIPTWTVEVEGGFAGASRNVARIPGDTGTKVDLKELTDPGAVARLEATWNLNRRQSLRLTYAPLEFEGSGTLDRPTVFAGTTFQPGRTEAEFDFSSYRLTYRHLFRESANSKLHLGGTLFVRDARIELQQGSTLAYDSDIGIVPLVYVGYERRLSERLSATVDFDGLAAPQGRAFDVAAKLRYALGNGWNVAAGYRTIEGGADNDEVYTFAWIHGAVVSARYSF